MCLKVYNINAFEQYIRMEDFMKFNELIKKRLGIVLAFALVISGGAVYAGVSVNSKKPADAQKEVTAGLTAGVSNALREGRTDSLDVTAGVTNQLYDGSMVVVTPNQLETVGQGAGSSDARAATSSDTDGKDGVSAGYGLTAGAGVIPEAGAVSDTATDETSTANKDKENVEDKTFCGYKKLGIAAVREGNLNVRAHATTDSKAVGKMTKHSACEILGKKDGWIKIQSGKVKGYVKSDYLVTGDKALEIAKDEVIKVASVNTTTLRVREKASEKSPILSLVGEGEDLVIEAEKNGWYKVEVDDQKGYISGDYVDISEKLPTAQTVKELKKGEGVSDSRVSLVQYALQFVGNPYVWGGTSLTHGIDCSGFTMQVYARYGVSLPHHAASQPGYGRRISASKAKPGDLFFYGNGSSIGHVGIYIGNGQIVHASNPRTGIKISSAFYRTPICVVSYL